MTTNELEIIIAEDNPGHAGLIKINLIEAGIQNKITHFKDGQQTLDFLRKRGDGPHMKPKTPYLLLLDIRMPKVDGIEVLKEVKSDKELQKLPVIMLTTTDDPREIQKCHELGCNSYITKPVDYNQFVEVLNRLGLFLKIMQVPETADN
ncbi:MAG: response regulator [bacterium]|nr:response regulator [bacterium]